MTDDFQIEDLLYQSEQQTVYGAIGPNDVPCTVTRLKMPWDTLQHLSETRFVRGIVALKNLQEACLRPVLDGGLDPITHSPWIATVAWPGESLEARQHQEKITPEVCELIRQNALLTIEGLKGKSAALSLHPEDIVLTAAADGKPVESFVIDYFQWFSHWAAGKNAPIPVDPVVTLEKFLNELKLSIPNPPEITEDGQAVTPPTPAGPRLLVPGANPIPNPTASQPLAPPMATPSPVVQSPAPANATPAPVVQAVAPADATPAPLVQSPAPPNATPAPKLLVTEAKPPVSTDPGTAPPQLAGPMPTASATPAPPPPPAPTTADAVDSPATTSLPVSAQLSSKPEAPITTPLPPKPTFTPGPVLLNKANPGSTLKPPGLPSGSPARPVQPKLVTAKTDTSPATQGAAVKGMLAAKSGAVTQVSNGGAVHIPSPTGSISGPLGTGPITGPLGTGPITGPIGTGPITGPLGTGSITAPLGGGIATGPLNRGQLGSAGQMVLPQTKGKNSFVMGILVSLLIVSAGVIGWMAKRGEQNASAATTAPAAQEAVDQATIAAAPAAAPKKKAAPAEPRKSSFVRPPKPEVADESKEPPVAVAERVTPTADPPQSGGTSKFGVPAGEKFYTLADEEALYEKEGDKIYFVGTVKQVITHGDNTYVKFKIPKPQVAGRVNFKSVQEGSLLTFDYLKSLEGDTVRILGRIKAEEQGRLVIKFAQKERIQIVEDFQEGQ